MGQPCVRWCTVLPTEFLGKFECFFVTNVRQLGPDPQAVGQRLFFTGARGARGVGTGVHVREVVEQHVAGAHLAEQARRQLIRVELWEWTKHRNKYYI